MYHTMRFQNNDLKNVKVSLFLHCGVMENEAKEAKSGDKSERV